MKYGFSSNGETLLEQEHPIPTSMLFKDLKIDLSMFSYERMYSKAFLAEWKLDPAVPNSTPS